MRHSPQEKEIRPPLFPNSTAAGRAIVNMSEIDGTHYPDTTVSSGRGMPIVAPSGKLTYVELPTPDYETEASGEAFLERVRQNISLARKS